MSNTIFLDGERGSKTIEVTTDANGCCSITKTLSAIISVTITGFISSAGFSNGTVKLDGNTIYSGAVSSGQKKSLNVSVSSGDHNINVSASGGPANTTVTVTVYYSIC